LLLTIVQVYIVVNHCC